MSKDAELEYSYRKAFILNPNNVKCRNESSDLVDATGQGAGERVGFTGYILVRSEAPR